MSLLNKIQLFKIRYILFGFILVAVACVLLLIKWELFESEKYLAIANERYQQSIIPSIRGSILASDGTTLAYSEPRFDAYVWVPELNSIEKANIQTREEFVTKVSAILGKDESFLQEKFSGTQLWIKIGEKLTITERDNIGALRNKNGGHLRGIQFQYVNKRIYPENKLASQILGYVMPADNDAGYKGVWGLEQYWDGLLKPQEGYQATEYDSFGNYISIGEDESIEPRPGSTLYTTINKSVQAVLEKHLKSAVERFSAKSATGVIINPKTGEIYALANYPDFDPNIYNLENDISVFGNLAISTPYEIGSVGKVFTVSAALDLGLVQANTVVLPEGHNGCEIISPNPRPGASCNDPERNKSGNTIDCICTFNRKPVKTPITVSSALIGSDNIGLRHVALSMTYENFFDYLVRFGVGKTTRIDLAGESLGMIRNASDWNYADQAVYSYGHGYSITPLEATMGIATVANNGERMQPYTVSKLIDADGKETIFRPKVEEVVIKPETCNTIIPMMNQVYLGNLIENKYKQYSKYYIALKSGTALIPFKDKAGYSNDINATFAGFDASPDRKFAMLIKLESPQVGDLSWENVRIVWLDTFIDIIDILKIQPYSP